MNREPAATAASAVPAARGRKMSITRLVEMTVEKVEKTVEKVRKVDKVLHPSDHPPVAPKPPLIQRISGVDDPSRIPIIGKLLPKPKPKVTPLSSRALRRSSSMPVGFSHVPVHYQSHPEGNMRLIDPERPRTARRPPQSSLGLNKKDPLPPLPSILKVRSVEQSEMFPTAPADSIPSTVRDLGSATRTFKRRSRSFSNFESVVIASSRHERGKHSVRFELQTTSEREEDGQSDESHQEEKAGAVQDVHRECSNSNEHTTQPRPELTSVGVVDVKLGSDRDTSKEQEHNSQKVKSTAEKDEHRTKKKVGVPETAQERRTPLISQHQRDLHDDNRVDSANRADVAWRDAPERKPKEAVEPENTNLDASAVQREREASKEDERMRSGQLDRRSISVSGLEDLAMKMKEINHRQGPAHIDSGAHVQSGAHAARGPVSAQMLRTRPSRVNLGPPPSASAGAAQYRTLAFSNASSRPQLAKGNPSQQRVPGVCNTTRIMTGDIFPVKSLFNASTTSNRMGVSVLDAHPSTASESTASIYPGKAASSHLSAKDETYAPSRVRLQSPPPQPAFQYESEPPSPTPSSVSSTGATIFQSEYGVYEYAGSVPPHLSFNGEPSSANDNDDMYKRKDIQTLLVHSSKSADILRRVRRQEEEDRAQRERVHRDVHANLHEGVDVAKAVSMWEGMSKGKQKHEGVDVAKAVSMWEGMSKGKQKQDETDAKDTEKEREHQWARETEMERDKERERTYEQDMAKEWCHPAPKMNIRGSHASTSVPAMPTILPLTIKKKTSTALPN